MLERDVEIGEDQPLGHQRDDLVDVRIGIDIVKPHPGAELAELAGEVGHVRAHLAALPRPGGVAEVDAIGRGVLADDQQLLRPGGDQLLGLAQDRVGAAADEVAAQRRDDAEGAAMVAALGDLQIGIVARGELQPGVRHQVEIGRRRHRRGVVDRADHAPHIGAAPVIASTSREARADQLGFLAHAAGDDDAAILGDRLADRGEALLLGANRGSRRC